MVKSSTTSGHLDIWKNAIEKADYSQMYPLVKASSGQEQYYIRSALHLFPHFMFSCCRGKSYIAIQEILVLEHCRVMLLLLLLCNFVVATTKLHIKRNNNKNRKINLHTFSVQLSITESLGCSCYYCCLILLLLCNFVVATTTKVHIKKNNNKNKKINLHTFSVQLSITESLGCGCYSCCLILLLMCNFVVATTTKVHIKKNNNKNKKINLHTFSVQLSITESWLLFDFVVTV